MTTRDELLAALRLRYGTASRRQKARILDELTAVTGYHRKHAIQLLTHEPGVGRARRPQRRVYGAEFAAALTVVWEATALSRDTHAPSSGTAGITCLVFTHLPTTLTLC